MENPLLFKVSLSFSAHSIARQLSDRISYIPDAKQVYLNTLGIYAVEFYLRCMGFETDWEMGDSRDAKMLKFLNIADLPVRGIGKLECRTVFPDDRVCLVPPEALENRIGYVVVCLDASLKQATLLGFTPNADREIPLDRLQSLDELLTYLRQLNRENDSRRLALVFRQFLAKVHRVFGI